MIVQWYTYVSTVLWRIVDSTEIVAKDTLYIIIHSPNDKIMIRVIQNPVPSVSATADWPTSPGYQSKKTPKFTRRRFYSTNNKVHFSPSEVNIKCGTVPTHRPPQRHKSQNYFFSVSTRRGLFIRLGVVAA